MATKRPSPDIEDCVDLYLDIWNIFEKGTFEPDKLVEQLVKHDPDISYITGDNEPERHLNILVEYGLLKCDNGRYCIRCTPEEDVEAWRDELQAPPEAIYRLVQQAKCRWQGWQAEGDEGDTLERNGETFLCLYADEDTDFTDLVRAVADRLSEPPKYTGVVVRAPANLIGYVQQLGDDLCDADAGLPYHFEILTSNVRGEHKDDLEYRLYLRQIS